jgi:hypothetical protein
MAAKKAPHDIAKIGDYLGMSADAHRNDTDQSFSASRQLQKQVSAIPAASTGATQIADQEVIAARTEAAIDPFPRTSYTTLGARLDAMLGRIAQMFLRRVSTSNGLTGGGNLGRDLLITPNYGTTASTICQGNDPRIASAVTKSRVVGTANGLDGGGNLAGDITLIPIYGAAANTICEGDDSRLSDSRTPTGSAGGSLSGTYPNPGLASTISAGSAALAKLTTGGADGSLTWNASGQITAYTAPT